MKKILPLILIILASTLILPSIFAVTPVSGDQAPDYIIITATAAGAGVGGTISPSGYVNVVKGDSQTFTITPDAGWHTIDLEVDGVIQGPAASYTFTNVVSEHRIRPDFAQDAFTITAGVPYGGGSISPESYVSVSNGGSQIFTITPDLGYHIVDVVVDGVSQGAITSYTYTNVIEEGHVIMVYFAVDDLEPIQVTIDTVNQNGVHLDGYVYGFSNPAPYVATVANGGGLGLYAYWGGLSCYPTLSVINKDTTYTVDALTGQVTSQSTPGVCVVKVVYEPIQVTFDTVDQHGVHLSGPLVNTGSFYLEGTPYVFAVAKGGGCGFVVDWNGISCWLVLPVVKDTTYSIDAVTGHITTQSSIGVCKINVVYENAAIDTFAITVNQGANGLITGPSSADWGTDASYTIVPSTGYHIVSVVVDGVSKGAVASYTISNVRETHTISASFAIDTFAITITQGANGLITGPNSANYGDSETFTVTPAAGYGIASIIVDGSPVSVTSLTGQTVSLTSIHASHTITATFVLLPRVLSSIGPVQVWVGLKNSDDVGIKFDLKAEVYKNGVLIGSGQLNSVAGGSSGINNAKLNSIPLNLDGPVSISAGDVLSINLYVRNAAVGSGKNSGTARLWFNDAQANSNFGITVNGVSSSCYLLNGFGLGTSQGTGPKTTIDIAAGAKGSGFKLFGTWNIVMS